jgi:hypothetical protein
MPIGEERIRTGSRHTFAVPEFQAYIVARKIDDRGIQNEPLAKNISLTRKLSADHFLYTSPGYGNFTLEAGATHQRQQTQRRNNKSAHDFLSVSYGKDASAIGVGDDKNVSGNI